MCQHTSCAAAIAMMALGWASIASAELQYNTIALSGAGGTSMGFGPNLGAGVDFSGFGPGFPVLNSTGHVAFFGFLTGSGVDSTNDRGIWSNAGGTAAVVARTGPGGPGPNLGAGINFLRFDFTPVLNAAGKVAFGGALTGSGVDTTNHQGIWSNSGGNLAVIARTGSAGPGPNLGPGVNFSNIGSSFGEAFGSPALNSTGAVAFDAYVAGSGVDNSNNRGIWSTTGGTLVAVARTGSSGPGPNLGPGVDFIVLDIPMLNAAGAVAFRGGLVGSGVDVTNNSGIWSSAGGTLAVIARSGSAGPGPNVGVGVNFALLSDIPVLNAAGEVAFRGTLTGSGVHSENSNGIWSNAGGTLVVIARTGSEGPGPNLGAGVNFTNIGSPGGEAFSRPALNAAGKVAFQGRLSGAGVDFTNNIGLWSNLGGALAVIARTGSEGPGPNLGAGVHFNSISSPLLNAAGNVVFQGGLTGSGVNDTNDVGIWTNAGGVLEKVVREGDLFDVDPGAGMDLRTISEIALGGFLGGEGGRPMGFNDAGLLIFRLSFTDGSSGIFTAQVPEPSGLAVLALCALLLIRRRRLLGSPAFGL